GPELLHSDEIPVPSQQRLPFSVLQEHTRATPTFSYKYDSDPHLQEKLSTLTIPADPHTAHSTTWAFSSLPLLVCMFPETNSTVIQAKHYVSPILCPTHCLTQNCMLYSSCHIEVYVGALTPLNFPGFRRTTIAGENWLKISEVK
ncbi:hypothetical protein LEMLEM_LOCUS8229, partial [Lemmus lemmus]